VQHDAVDPLVDVKVAGAIVDVLVGVAEAVALAQLAGLDEFARPRDPVFWAWARQRRHEN